MMIRIDHSSSQPLHEQIAGQIRAAIADGGVGPGERLPPSRQLASGLDVNINTLLRALQTLRDEGLIDMRRGRGTFVTGKAPVAARYVELAEQLVAEAKRSGLSRQDIIKLVEDRI